MAATGAPTGWRWLGFLGKGDYLSFIGVAALASISIVCYARMIPTLPKLQARLAAIQVAVYSWPQCFRRGRELAFAKAMKPATSLEWKRSFA